MFSKNLENLELVLIYVNHFCHICKARIFEILTVCFIFYIQCIKFVTEQFYAMLYIQKKHESIMNTTVKYGAFVALLILVIPYLAFADQGSSQPSSNLQLQLASVTCVDTHATSYLSDVVNVINNSTITSTITTTDIPKLNADFTALQSDATGNNTAQFKIDSKQYSSDQRTASLDAIVAIRAMHNKTINSELRSDNAQLQSAQKSCLFAVNQQRAQIKIQKFDRDVTHAWNLSGRLSEHGANTTNLNQTIGNAYNQIQAFQSSVDNAQNKTQLRSALNSFCLYNGCKTGDNFHFAANAVIQASQAKLNLLAGQNSTASFQALVGQARTDLTNAQTALTQVGGNQYQGTQSSTVWGDIKAAGEIIHQLQHIVNHKH